MLQIAFCFLVLIKLNYAWLNVSGSVEILLTVEALWRCSPIIIHYVHKGGLFYVPMLFSFPLYYTSFICVTLSCCITYLPSFGFISQFFVIYWLLRLYFQKNPIVTYVLLCSHHSILNFTNFFL